MVDLAGRPYFFVSAAVGLSISEVMDLAIGGDILIGTNVTISFSGLSL